MAVLSRFQVSGWAAPAPEYDTKRCAGATSGASLRHAKSAPLPKTPAAAKPLYVRARAAPDGEIAQRDIVALLGALTEAGVDVIKTENLGTFDGVKGFALGQGQ